MIEHFLPDFRDIISLIEAGQQRQCSTFDYTAQDFFAVFAVTQKTGIVVITSLDIFFHTVLFDAQHDVKKGAVDAGLGDFFCLKQLAELFVVEKVIELIDDTVGKFHGYVHVTAQVVGRFIQKFVLHDKGKVILVDRIFYAVVVF